MPDVIVAVVVAVLALATAFSFIHAKSKRIAAEDHAASNARVLREFERMCIHRPHFIVDYRPRNYRKAPQ